MTQETNDQQRKLMFDMQLEIHATINQLTLLDNAALNYAETCNDLDAQAAFYGLHTSFMDRKAALQSLTERF